MKAFESFVKRPELFQDLDVYPPNTLLFSDLIIVNVAPLLSHLEWKVEAPKPSVEPLQSNWNFTRESLQASETQV